MQYIMMDGKIRRVLSVDGRGAALMVKVVVGTRDDQATAGKRPGNSWRPDPSGKARSWVKTIELVEDRSVFANEILEIEGWPVGIVEMGQDLDKAADAVRPSIHRAIKAPENRAKRTPPELPLAVLEGPLKRAGFAMPTEEELEGLIGKIWAEVSKPTRRPRDARASALARAIVNPRRQAPQPEPEPEEIPEPESPEPESPEPVEETASAPAESLERQAEPEPTKEGEFYSTPLKRNLADTDTNRLMDVAATRGWPEEAFSGADRKTTGAWGKTMSYMAKTPYDEAKHKPGQKKA